MVLPVCYSCQTTIKDSAYKKIILVDHTNQTFAVHTHFFPPCFNKELISTQLPQYRIIGTGDVFQTVVGDSTTAEFLLDSNIDGVSFTGGVNVGAKVGQKALSKLKKCVLELGGSDPFIVCTDANIEKAANGALKGRFINCGQSCIASKRFFVVKDVAEEFIDKFVKKTEKLEVGDPLDEDTGIGPLVNKSALETAQDQVDDAIAKGANLLTGGKGIERKGFFSPTIISEVKK